MAGAAYGERIESLPGPLWQRIRAEPARAPEHIALAAAERFAPAAERWARSMRAHHGSHEAAVIARDRHVRLARVEGAAGGLGGALTVLPDLAALAWIQGRMVFFIAAVYGFDVRHPMRPAELLALQDLYDTPADARAALDGVGTRMADRMVAAARDGEQPLPARLLKLAGRKAAERAMSRLVPILSSATSSVQNARATSTLGARALLYYGGAPDRRVRSGGDGLADEGEPDRGAPHGGAASDGRATSDGQAASEGSAGPDGQVTSEGGEVRDRVEHPS